MLCSIYNVFNVCPHEILTCVGKLTKKHTATHPNLFCGEVKFHHINYCIMYCYNFIHAYKKFISTLTLRQIIG